MAIIRLTPDVKRDLQKAETISEQCLGLCMQCGTCSASCPNTGEMDYSPRALMHLVQLGLLERALDSKTIWTCSSCLQCSARCPRGIDLARVMEALRALRLRARWGRLEPGDLSPACADAPPVLLVSAMRKLTG